MAGEKRRTGGEHSKQEGRRSNKGEPLRTAGEESIRALDSSQKDVGVLKPLLFITAGAMRPEESLAGWREPQMGAWVCVS